jgi:rubrerythrin
MRKKYEMRCKVCGYHYWFIGEWYSYERCPVCGHGASFDEFKCKEEDIEKSSY